MYCIQHCFICRPSDSTMSEDTGIEPRTVATSALAVRSSKHSARSHPRSAISHPRSARSHPHSARSHPQLGQISSKLGYISFTVSARSHSIMTFKLFFPRYFTYKACQIQFDITKKKQKSMC
jgi:hypothetical protein